MDPITSAYLKILEEDTKTSGVVDSTKSQVGKTFGDKEKNATTVVPKSATENADGELENPDEADSHLSSDPKAGETKPLKVEAHNPFDLLYNKILNEEDAFNFSTDDNSLEADLDVEGEDDGGLSEFDDTEEGSEDEESEEVTVSLSKDVAQALYDMLGSVLSPEGEEDLEGEEELGDDLGELDGGLDGEENEDLGLGEDDNLARESVDAKTLGTPIKDSEKLKKGMDKPGNIKVKGKVVAGKKSAQAPQVGKGFDGKLKPHSTEGAISKLQSKKQDVGGVRVGKGLFDS